jgi:hypothetical protein
MDILMTPGFFYGGTPYSLDIFFSCTVSFDVFYMEDFAQVWELWGCARSVLAILLLQSFAHV